MSITKNSTALKFAAGFIGLAMALSMVAPSTASAQSIDDLTAQINGLLATIASLQAQLAGMTGGGGSSASVCPFAWTTDLTTGAQGPDVMALQKFLNSNPATQVAASGVGSAGSETDYFGGLTAGAVSSFQDLYAAQVLTPVGLSAGTGYFGPSTRAHMNSLCTSAPVVVEPGDDDDDDTPEPVAGTGVTLGSGSQPGNSIAPLGASRVPFTVFTLTAGSDGPVTFSNVTVERTGFADNDNFAGIVLLGPDMEQLGDAKTLNSNNQAKVGTSYTIPAGATHTFTIAGNRAPALPLPGNDGQVASLSLVAVNTSATVSGALPITGASHVMNETLTIGTAVVTVGPSDLDVIQSDKVGETNRLFASVRIENTSSKEDARLRSIRFQNVGSVSATDIDNIRVVVDGVEYPTVVSGDFYTATFGSGVIIAEGFNKEVVLRGDIVSGSARTVQFNIDKNTDIYVTGETYGFGIIPTASGTEAADTGAEMTTSGSPFFDGTQFSIGAGSISTFSKSNNVPAQNIAINVPNQPLGAFEVEVKGEPLTIQTMIFHFDFNASATLDGADVTNITLVDGNGAIIAGPQDGAILTAANNDMGKVTFSDTVTLPVGVTTLTLKGKLATAFVNDDTVSASTTPANAAAQWVTVKGEDTGDSITLSNAATQGNTMTVKALAVAAKVSTSPAAQTVVAGVSGMTIANIQMDASQSGEDARFTALKLRYTNATGGDATNCRLYDGDTLLTDDAVNPLTTATGYTFSLSQALVVAKGTIKTIAVKCDIAGSVADGSQFSFGIHTSDTITATGVDSGTTDTADDAIGIGPVMTVASAGTFTVTKDSSSPSYTVAAAGTSDVTLGVLKFAAINEDIRLDRIGLQLSNLAATSGPEDLLSLGIYNGSTQVGTAVFSGTNRFATSTLTETVIIPKDDDMTLTIKGTLSEIGTSKPGTQGALVQVDFDGHDPTATKGIGMDSGTTIYDSSADTAVDGVRMFRSLPIFAKLAVPSGSLVNSDNTFYRFSITADSADDLSIYKLTFTMATSSGMTEAAITDTNVYAYTDSGFSIPVSGVRADGGLDLSGWSVSSSTAVEVIVQNAAGATTPLEIPAGVTRYFEIRGTAASVATNDSVTTKILGDAAYPVLGTLMGQAASIPTANDDFIWSPQATSTSVITAIDWTNGYGLVGLPAISMTGSVLSD